MFLGWGFLENGERSDVLMKATVPLVSMNQCATLFKTLSVYTSYLCAGGHNKTDTCHGDSGKLNINKLKFTFFLQI